MIILGISKLLEHNLDKNIVHVHIPRGVIVTTHSLYSSSHAPYAKPTHSEEIEFQGYGLCNMRI
jgi:hypothetical protein